MPSIALPIASTKDRSKVAATSRLVNCFAQEFGAGASRPFGLVRAPGITSWATVGTGPIEGMHVDHGTLYVVSGGGFYTVTSTPTATFRGAVGSSTEIDIDSNDIGVVIVSPPNAYSYTLSGTAFAQITDADFLGAGDVEFVDNFLIFRDPDTGVFFGADLGSLTAFDALNFATAEAHPDTLVGMKVDHRQVLLFGEKSIELWENTGISGFPFERMINGYIEIGCINGKTIAKGDNSVFFVANDYTVRRLDGITPVRISNHAVDQWLRTVTIASLRGWFYALEGHLVYVLTAPEGAYFFDMTTQSWTERSKYGSEPEWPWGNPVWFGGKVLVGSTTSNVIAELSPTTYTELTDTLRAEVTFNPVYTEGARAYHDRFEIAMKTGVGRTSGQGSDPEAMLSFSHDGGETWHNLPNKKIGKLGERETRVVWHALGSCASTHGRTYRVAVSDPVPVTIYDALLEVRGGRL